MRNDLRELLFMLSVKEYRTASELAKELGVSTKAIRNRLKELGDIGRKYGVHVEAKARYGFILTEETENGIKELLEAFEDEAELPEDAEGRTNYLIEYLLNHEDYTKMDDLCDFLCISRSTLQISVKQAEEILADYDLSIDRRPNYGICVKGEKENIRRCFEDYFEKKHSCIFSRNLSE